MQHQRGVQRFDLEVGVASAVFLDGEFADGNLRDRRRKRAATDVVTFLTPESTAETLGAEVIEGGNLVQGPVGIDRSGPLKVGPENDFGLGGAEQARLGAGAEAVVIDRGGKLLRAFEGFADGGFAALVAGEGEIGAGGSQG